MLDVFLWLIKFLLYMRFNKNSPFKIIFLNIPSHLYITLKNKSFILASYLVKHVIPDTTCLEYACFDKNIQKIVLNILNQKIIPSEICIKNAIQNELIKLIDILIRYGAVPTEECLIEACKIHNKTIIINLLKILMFYNANMSITTKNDI